MLIDLHTHTSPCSPCSTLSASALIEAAISCGLDAICVTDHLTTSGGREAQTLARKHYGYTVFVGQEARTTLGDILVFGVDEDFPDGIEGPELLCRVRQQGGASVLAHPFRRGGGAAFWSWLEKQDQPLDASLAARPELARLDAIETSNGHVNPQERALAEDLARILGLPTCGGSDAHATWSVGKTATEFAQRVTDEIHLAREISAGRLSPRQLR